MPNPWTDYLHKWASEHKVSYMCALTDPKAKEGYVPVKVAKRNARLARKAEKEKAKGKTTKGTQKKKKLADEVLKIEEKIKKDFVPAIKDVFFYIKKILFSKKPPTQEKFEEEIGKIKKKHNIDYGNKLFGQDMIIKTIFDIWNEEVKEGKFDATSQQQDDDAGRFMWNIWSDCLESEYYEYWNTETDFVNAYRDTKGLEHIEKGIYADDDENGSDIVNDAFYEIYESIFTYEWFLKNIKK